MIGEDFALMAAWDGLKRALSAYWGRKTKKRRKELISTVVAELLKLDPDLTAAEAKLAAAELTGEPPDRELLRAKTMLGSAKLYSRVRKKTKAKKYVFAPKKKRAIKKVAKKKKRDDGTGGRHSSSQPTSGTIDGAPTIQTPSRAELGLGGRFCFTATGAEFKEIFLSTRSACPLTLSSPQREFLSVLRQRQTGHSGVLAGGNGHGNQNAKLDIVEVEQHGDTAIEVGQYKLSGADDQVMDTGKYIVIWKHEDDTWKLHHDIWNSSLAQR